MSNAAREDTKRQLWQMVQTINRTCREGKGFDRLAGFFRDNVVVVPPGFTARAEGKAVCLKSYEDACSKMAFEKLEASDQQIDVFGSTAVVAYKYDCIWEYRGKKLEDDGHEILVCTQDDGTWKIAWRTLLPGSRQAQDCPMEESEGSDAAGTNITQVCLDLMRAAPACYLTTIDADGFPHTTAMLNLRDERQFPSLAEVHEDSDNGFLLYMTTSVQSPKMARLESNPKVSAYFCDPDQIVGLMLGGEIEVVADQELKSRIWQEGWTMYYPNGPEGPEYGVIKLAPTVAKGWCKNAPFEFEL
ncbi:MAG: pyridoxamine 5'-phosphate oxidase family protein [Planctomycetota bacterium]|jgi:general stress protein 26/ketosteroid isomerase-like protein